MPFYFNHQSEAIAACCFAEDPRQVPPPCTCQAEDMVGSRICSHCQCDYEQSAATVSTLQRAAYEAFLESLPEPCGQQFPDEPPDLFF